MDLCYIPYCREIAGGVCQWCFQPVCGKHSISVDGPNFLYFYLCKNCDTSNNYAILYNRIFYKINQTIQIE